jgi:hypothetical protein
MNKNAMNDYEFAEEKKTKIANRVKHSAIKTNKKSACLCRGRTEHREL